MTTEELAQIEARAKMAMEPVVGMGEVALLPTPYPIHVRLTEAEWQFYLATRKDVPALVAEVRRLRELVGFSKCREHRKGCPGIQAWDVPGACSCDEPEVVRCKVCGARQRKDTPLEVGE